MLQIETAETGSAPKKETRPRGLALLAGVTMAATVATVSVGVARWERSAAIGQCPNGWPTANTTKVFNPSASYASLEQGVAILEERLKNDGIVVARSVQSGSFEVYADIPGNLSAVDLKAAKLVYKEASSGHDNVFIVSNQNQLSELGQVYCDNPYDNGPAVAFTPRAEAAITAMEQGGTSFDWPDGLAIDSVPTPSAGTATIQAV